jgi:predicted MFS family arabinose efflux permease
MSASGHFGALWHTRIVESVGEATAPSEFRLFKTNLPIIVVAAACNYLAFGISTVLLPSLVTEDLGGGDLAVGVVVGSFALSAMVTRPKAGHLGNQLGRRTLMLVGALIIGASFAAYGFSEFLAILLVLRLVTGTGEALFYTGAATMVADLAPPDQRTTAIGYYSVAIYVGTGLGPALGDSLGDHFGFRAAFLIAGVLACTSGLLSLTLPNHRIAEDPTDERQPLLNRAALLPGCVLALGVMGTVAFQAYVPLYVEEIGLDTSQWVFLLYSVVMISIRAFAKPIHRMDPRRAAFGAMVTIAVGLATIAAVPSPAALYIGTAILACGFAVQFPALMAMAINRASERDRSSAVGTYTAFMNLSIAAGGLLLAIPAELSGYRASFAFGALSALAGVLFLRLAVRPAKSSPAALTG